MTHVVTEACIRCKYTDCVDVCPVDCFREGPNFLTIDPDECIDCAVCIPECPVGAIYAEEDVPKDQQHMIKINADLALLPNWKSITKRKSPLPDHEHVKHGERSLGLVLDQDSVNLPHVQKGMNSAAYKGLWISSQERRIRHMHKTLMDYIGENGK